MMTDSGNTEEDEVVSLVDSIDFESHTSTTNSVMNRIMVPSYDTEDTDFDSFTVEDVNSFAERGIPE